MVVAGGIVVVDVVVDAGTVVVVVDVDAGTVEVVVEAATVVVVDAGTVVVVVDAATVVVVDVVVDVVVGGGGVPNCQLMPAGTSLGVVENVNWTFQYLSSWVGPGWPTVHA